MGNRTIQTRTIAKLLLLPVFVLAIASCTHEELIDVNIPPPDFEYGTSLVKIDDGWNFDKAHSNVMWETAYLGSAAMLTGRFNSFVASVNFDENNPENTTITGTVTLSSVNTGEPNRDGGCLLNTFGVTESDEATITSTEVKKDGEGGYNVTALLNFHGFEKEVQMKLHYTGITYFGPESGLNGAPFSVAGFIGEFEFNAISDFGIQTSNISDKVLVRINAQLKKPG